MLPIKPSKNVIEKETDEYVVSFISLEYCKISKMYIKR